MLVILSAGFAPGLALLSYFYLRDEFETEPVSFIIKDFLVRCHIDIPDYVPPICYCKQRPFLHLLG